MEDLTFCSPTHLLSHPKIEILLMLNIFIMTVLNDAKANCLVAVNTYTYIPQNSQTHVKKSFTANASRFSMCFGHCMDTRCYRAKIAILISIST